MVHTSQRFKLSNDGRVESKHWDPHETITSWRQDSGQRYPIEEQNATENSNSRMSESKEVLHSSVPVK